MSESPPDKAAIIVADDDELTRVMYKRILEKRSYEVRTCENGLDVLAEFALSPADLIILDNNMPQMNGRQTTEALRQSSRSWNVPIIIVSAQDDEEHILEGLAFGADDYLVKPVGAAELLAKIQVALKKRQFAGPGAVVGPGSVFNGKYQIDRLLGEGGCSRVFAARNVKTQGNPWVALKLFDMPKTKRLDTFMAYFLREAYEHARLDHPNIVKLLDFGQVEGCYFLVMEHLDGITTADRLNLGDPFDEKELVYIAHALADALACLDNHQLIHRDLKPSNIMICSDGDIKLLDFGLAKNPREETLDLGEDFSGTPAYMSPEQILNNPDIDIRSDIYSLGATLYRLTTGEKPFDGNSPMAILKKHLEEDPRPVRELRPGLCEPFAQLIDQCLRRNRDARPGIGELQMLCEILLS